MDSNIRHPKIRRKPHAGVKRYQDYVIKDGKLIGQFEEMYRQVENPWHQASTEYNANSYSRVATMLTIRRNKISSVVEFGCGLGYYTNLIHTNLHIKVKGVDISETAIEKAKRLWPDLEFSIDEARNVGRYSKFEAVLLAEITWYILPDFDYILKEMKKHLAGKYLLHNLVFYKGRQQYGNEFFTTLKEFIDYMPFKLLACSEATTIESDTIETSTMFKIQPK